MTIPMIKEQHLDTIRNYLLDIPVDFLRSAMDYRTLLIMTGNILSNFNDTSLFNMYSPTSGRVVTLKTGRWEVPVQTLVALVDPAVRSFPWFSPKLA